MASAPANGERPVRDMFVPHAGGPTAARMVLGAQLRRLRRANSITTEAAGHVIRASDSKISRLERGAVAFKERDVADLLTLYGVHDKHERAALLQLAQEASRPGWWHKYGDLLPGSLEIYVGLEEAASRIRTYETQFIPALLQTGQYARAIIEAQHPEASLTEIDRRVAVRLTRQEILTRQAAPQLWAVVEEEALRRPVGGPGVMRDQIEHLIEITELPNVTLRIMPSHSTGAAGTGGPFTILRFPELDLPDVVYVEHLTSAIYLDKRSDTERYLAVMDRLLLQAGQLPATTAILHGIRDDLSRTQS